MKLTNVILCWSMTAVLALGSGKPCVGNATESTGSASSRRSLDSLSTALFRQIDFGPGDSLKPWVFRDAFLGYERLKAAGKLPSDKPLLTVVDFSLSSCEKRIWVIDLSARKVLFHTYVAHGQGSGEDMALRFSNQLGSHASSLGFYVTDTCFEGVHGNSLRLKGMDSGFNDAALDRGIVMHGAYYVSDSFIADEGRLGRSWGCPALPLPCADTLIQTIKEGTCLFLYFPDETYLEHSCWLRPAPRPEQAQPQVFIPEATGFPPALLQIGMLFLKEDSGLK